MESILVGFVLIIGIIVVTSIINEKKLHIQHDIALVIFSFLLSVILLIVKKIYLNEAEINIDLDTFMLKYMLCFMLFASASKVHLNKFVKNVVPIRNVSSNYNSAKLNPLWLIVFLYCTIV